MDDILLVEDDAAGRAMLCLSLKQAGFTVQCASSGPEGLAKLKARAFRWLITDGRMTPMDGAELARQARALQPDLRIVLMSAVWSEHDTVGAPIEKVFPKPIVLEALIQWLRPA